MSGLYSWMPQPPEKQIEEALERAAEQKAMDSDTMKREVAKQKALLQAQVVRRPMGEQSPPMRTERMDHVMSTPITRKGR